MNSLISENRKFRPIDRVLDALLFFFVFIYVSAGLPFLAIFPSVHILFEQKPIYHRFCMLFFGISALSLFMIQFWQGRPSLFRELLKKVSPLFLFLSAALLWTLSSWIRYEAFQAGFDFAIFMQAIANTVRGDFLYSSIKGGICLLGDHFSPILALLAAPYAIWQDPKIILLIQAAAVASCVFPIYRIAHERLQNSTLAMIFAAAFVFYLPTINAVRFEFHPELLVMPVLLWAFHALLHGRLWRASLLLFLSLLSKENAALITFAFGLYALIAVPKAKGFGVFWMIFSYLYFYVITTHVMPLMSGQEYFYLRGNYGAWKEQGLGAFFSHVLRPASGSYLIKIFAPLGFLSFLGGPTLLLTFPMLLQNLIARNESAISIFFQYTVFLTPFVFVSAIEGAKRWSARYAHLLGFYLVAAILFMAGPSEFYIMNRNWAAKPPNREALKAYFSTIPSEDSVRTHEFFAGHLANRKQLHIYENQNPIEGRSVAALNADRVILSPLNLPDPAAAIAQLELEGYQQVHSAHDVWDFSNKD